MTKKHQLRVCDRLLALLLLPVLASSIQLEITGSSDVMAVVLHLILVVPFMLLIIWHIYLHLGWRKWISKFSKFKQVATRVLWWLYVLTFVSGIAATTHWGVEMHHSPIGAIHGKIGFLMIALAAGHTLKRRTRL